MRRSIASKNAFVMILAVVLLASLLSFFSINTLTDKIQDEITNKLINDATHRMNKIDRFFFERLGDIRLLLVDRYGILSNNIYSIDEKMDYLESIQNKKKVYESISLYSVDGIKIGDTKNVSLNKNISGEIYYEYAINNLIYVDYKPIYSIELEAPVIHFSGPVHDTNGNIINILVASFLIDTINQIVIDDSDQNQDTTMNLVDQDGEIIYSNSNSSISNLAKLEVFKEAKKRSSGIATSIEEFEGEETLLVAISQKGYKEYTGENWIFITGIPTSVAFESARELTNRIIILTMLFLGLVISLSLLLSYFITKPITELSKSASNLAKGNFNTKVNIHSGDELEKLGEVFNKATDSLAASEKEREEIEKLKTQFISMVTHDMKSPMASVKMTLKLMLENDDKSICEKLGKKQKELLSMISQDTNQVLSLIDDFMIFSKLSQAKLQFAFEKINLSKHVRNLVKEMKTIDAKKKLSIKLEMNKLKSFEVDPNRVMQVLRNILNNAIKFSKEKEKIIVKVKAKKNYLLFSVQDFGIGIPKENQENLFEPFNQGAHTTYKDYGGTGLGTTICKGIIECQKGKIWFDSKEGKGTTFYFTVPYKPVKKIKPLKSILSKK